MGTQQREHGKAIYQGTLTTDFSLPNNTCTRQGWHPIIALHTTATQRGCEDGNEE